MTALLNYNTGTVSVAADGTIVTGVSTLWATTGNVKSGDLFQSGHFCSFVIDVTDDTHIAILPWAGGALSGAAYAIWKLPRSNAQVSEDVDRIVTSLNDKAFMVFVPPGLTAPDPSLGEENQNAIQPTTGKVWLMTGGVWTYLGIYRGFNPRGAYDNAATYSTGDWVSSAGSSYVWSNATPGSGHAPPDVTYWQLLASKGDPGTNGTNGTNGAAGPTPWTAPASWATATNYVAGPPASAVVQGGETYVCLVPHTSGTFATDLAAGKWIKVAQKGADGTATLADVDRRNFLLDRIYQSKLFAGYRRFLSAFADGYGASDGVNAGSSSNYTVDTSGKRVLPSVGFSRLSGGTPTTLAGTAANINDNSNATTITWTGGDLSAASINSRILAKIDYGSNQTITKIEAKQYVQSAGSNSLSGFYYSTDGTNWTQLGANITVTTTPTDFSVTGNVTARYIAFVLGQVTYSGANVTLADLNGYVSTPNNMAVVTTSQTADASVSNGRAIIEYDNTAAPTLNTDLTVEVTCNGGTNWTAATLSLVSSNGQGGRSIAETADTACTSGTSFAARIKTFNNKSIPVHGISLTVH